MRGKGMLGALLVVLLAQSPAFARMHADSPPTAQSFVFIAIWIGAMTWLFSRFYGAGRLALAFGLGTVASAIVLGEYVDSLLHVILRVPPEGTLPLGIAFACACAVSFVAQAVAATWAGYATGGRTIRLAEAIRGLWFWVVLFIPGLYLLVKTYMTRT